MLNLSRWKSNLVTILLMILVYLAIRHYQLQDYQTDQAPAFSAANQQGQVINLLDFRGQPLILYFWADWCPVCKLQKDNIEELADDYNIITVASWSGTENNLYDYFQHPKLQQTTIIDPDGIIASRYGVSGVPSIFIIDSNGIIQYIERGFTTTTGIKLRLLTLP